MTKTKLLSTISLLLMFFMSVSLMAQPTITQQPTNQEVAVGQTATFNLVASSTNPISYQWYKNGGLIAGATANNYTTPPTVLGDNGAVFYCIVTDIDGFVESNNATLLVGEPPVITSDPKDSTVTEGDPVSFSVTATGTIPLNYQWRKNGVDVPGATGTIYSIASANISENGDVYSCVVTNTYGITLSNNATLTVNAGVAPIISEQPQDVAVFEGSTGTFTVTATGSLPLNYQWKKDGVDISGATTNSYTTPSAILADDGTVYTCVISNNFGTLTTDDAQLFVTGNSTRVTSGIQVLYEFEENGGDVIRDVSGNGVAEDIQIITPENTAWTPNGLETFFGATTRKETEDSKLREACVASNEITLETWILPEFIPQSARRIFTFSQSGSIRNFSIIAEGDHYEFRLTTDSTDLNGFPALSSTAGTQSQDLTHLVYTRSNDGTAKVYVNGVLNATGYVPGSLNRFKDFCRLAIGSEPLGGLEWRGMHYLAAVYDRALTDFEVQHNYNIGTPVDNKPAFTIHPKDQNIIEGESLLLDSYAVSVLPLTYQWTKNGVAIPGATNRKLNLENLGSLDNGAVFRSTATTSSGTTISNAATLYVTGIGDRVNGELLYTFSEGSGTLINDVSGLGSPLNLNIFNSDAVEWVNNGLQINSAPSVVTTNSATKIISPIKASNEMSIEAWLSTSNLNQAAPAKIFTVSADENSRNFTLGQNNDSYEVSIRTTTRDNNGSPAISSSAGTVSETGFDHVVFTRASDGTAKFFINGTERVSTTVDGNFSNWNDVYLLSLGNEFGVDHHWEGLVNLISVFDRPLSNSEVLRNYNFGPWGVVYKPTNLSLVSNEIGSISLSWTDNSTNEEGFIIERGTGDPVVYTQVGTVPKDSTSFVDESIVDNTIYTYRVKAYYNLGESDYSDVLVVQSLITPLSPPTDLSYQLNDRGYPELTWVDPTELETNFEIARRKTGGTPDFTPIDTVGANVTTYTDWSAEAFTTYVYKIKAFNQDTSSSYSDDLFVEVLDDVEGIDAIPTEYSLSQNYPNPFNPTTTIKFGLPEAAQVTIVLYNVLGQEVMNLSSREYAAGRHSFILNAENLTSGLYIYSISAKGVNGNDFIETKKMLLMK